METESVHRDIAGYYDSRLERCFPQDARLMRIAKMPENFEMHEPARVHKSRGQGVQVADRQADGERGDDAE